MLSSIPFVRVFQLCCWAVFVIQLVFGCWALVALAQETSAPAASVSWLETLMAVVKAVLPQMLGFLSALLTKAIAMGLAATPSSWLHLVSSVLGALAAAITSALEGLPVDAIQAEAAVGVGAGLVGHRVLQVKPIQ